MVRASILLILVIAASAQEASYSRNVTGMAINLADLKTGTEIFIGNFTDLNITIEGCNMDSFAYDYDILEAKIANWTTQNMTKSDVVEAIVAMKSLRKDTMKCGNKLIKVVRKCKSLRF